MTAGGVIQRRLQSEVPYFDCLAGAGSAFLVGPPETNNPISKANKFKFNLLLHDGLPRQSGLFGEHHGSFSTCNLKQTFNYPNVRFNSICVCRRDRDSLFSRLRILMETRTIVANSSNAKAPTITNGDTAK